MAGLLACTAPIIGSAAHAAEPVPEHVIETQDVPFEHRAFILDTTDTRLDDIRFASGQWMHETDGGNNDRYWPLTIGASFTIPHVGAWTGPDGTTKDINAVARVDDWNGCYAGEWGNDGHFWLFAMKDLPAIPKTVTDRLGTPDMTRRAGCSWTMAFQYDDGTPVPDSFKAVTGFNDLDGLDANPDVPFEGVELLDGFDGAYHVKDAELARYGVNGYAGSTHDAGDESDLNGDRQSKHRLAATWTGPTFTFRYSLDQNHGALNAKTTFGTPITRLYPLLYDPNGGAGTLPEQSN